ncbi:MAG: inorganic phosphate transporter [Chryseotalea sp.]
MTLYILLLVLLFMLAIIDLIVGVSNDAVNFLNSAIGSKVAPVRVVLAIASAGILAGAVFSEGMMEIARSGIFQPSFFSFEKVMIIFLAVMFTDVILLDIYNSYGLPTSTTVSLVFELLGASFFVGLFFLFEQQKPIGEISGILNYQSAITIIGGIFLSVLVSFFASSVIHFFVRATFTFRLKKTIKLFGSVFSGLSLMMITYFLLIKGLKGTSLISKESVQWINENTYLLLLLTFVGWSLLSEVALRFFKINPLKIIVLTGTFALAMAFAGNDLVNFIGIAAAGLSAFELWVAQALPANQFFVGALAGSIATSPWILIISGVIMVITLWTNAKSRKVTETEISLSRQDEGEEKFKANLISRALVASALAMGELWNKVMPAQTLKQVNSRFFQLKKPKNKNSEQTPSFDLLRASVNLVVSSALIAYGTASKLPLSTTFVTFMVAMGTSLADRAWGLESAVYRIAGVMQVIGGWLLTALFAFLGSAAIATFLYFTNEIGILILTFICGFLLVRSHLLFNKKEEKAKKENETFIPATGGGADKNLVKSTRQAIAQQLSIYNNVMDAAFLFLQEGKKSKLEKSFKSIQHSNLSEQKYTGKVIKLIRQTDNIQAASVTHYLQTLDALQNLQQSIKLIGDLCLEHHKNFHPLPDESFKTNVQGLSQTYNLVHIVAANLLKEKQSETTNQEEQIFSKAILLADERIEQELNAIRHKEISNRLATFQIRILLEVKDVFGSYQSFYQAYHKVITKSR